MSLENSTRKLFLQNLKINRQQTVYKAYSSHLFSNLGAVNPLGLSAELS